MVDYTATISYGAGNPVAETTTIESYDFFNDMEMKPLVPIGQAPADVDIPLVFGFDTYSTGTNRAFFNEM